MKITSLVTLGLLSFQAVADSPLPETADGSTKTAAEYMRSGFELLKESDPFSADVEFRKSDSLQGAFASATIRCMLGEYGAEENPCPTERNHIIELAKKGNIDAIVLTSMGSEKNNPFQFDDADAEWARTAMIEKGIGDHDRIAGNALLKEGDHSGAVLLRMAAERLDPIAQYEMAQHMAMEHTDWVESLYWLTAAYKNGVFQLFGVDSKAADNEYDKRYQVIRSGMNPEQSAAFDTKLVTIDKHIGPEATNNPSPALMVVGQVAEILANPADANAHATELSVAPRAINEIKKDVIQHEATLSLWANKNVALPDGCNIGIAQMESGEIADIGFAPDCGLSKEEESVLRKALWDIPQPPAFQSYGDKPPFFTISAS